jgi:pimeloyl-ACP methyl ester carboxylesterase
MPHCHTSQGKVYYEVTGSGAPLCLLHADGSSGAEFAPVVPRLAESYQVVVVDNPGCGRSARRAFSYDYYKENAKAAFDVAKQTTSEPVRVIGTGGGAVVALWMAILAPSRLRGVVADSFVEFYLSEDVRKDLAAHQAPTEEMISFWREMNGEDWPDIIRRLDRVVAVMAEQKRSVFNWRLEEVKCPVLVTGSRQDHLLSDIGRRLQEITKQMPHARLVLYEEGGHPAMWSQAENFWQDALKFLGEL